MERDIELPFDELDPCCQREIERERKAAAVGRELRKDDRSNRRNDLISTVFSNFNRFKNCGCCKLDPVDYNLLDELKRQQNREQAADEQADIDDADHGDEDSDDELFRALEEPTPFEQQRLLEMKAAVERLEAAKKIGYGIHREDSIAHIEDMIQLGQVVLCHICDTKSIVCAQIDISLETIARKYLGTVFRRLNMRSNTATDKEELQQFRSKWRIADNASTNTYTYSPCLAIFSGGDLISSTSDLDRFIDPAHRNGIESFPGSDATSLTVRELERFLDQSRALHLSPPSYMAMESTQLLRSIHAAGGDGNEDDEDDDGGRPTSSYCGHPGCGRNFPHEHVGGSGMTSLSGTGTLLGAQTDKGSEALAKDWHKV